MILPAGEAVNTGSVSDAAAAFPGSHLPEVESQISACPFVGAAVCVSTSLKVLIPILVKEPATRYP